MKINYIIPQLNSSADIGMELQGAGMFEPIDVVVESIEGDITDILDVKFNIVTRKIHIILADGDD